MMQIDAYKNQLLNAWFFEAKYYQYRFLKAVTESTAFVVNLMEKDCNVAVLYGFCTTSYAPEYKVFLKNGEETIVIAI